MRRVIDEDVYQLSLLVEPPKNIEKKNNIHILPASEYRRTAFDFFTQKDRGSKFNSNRYLKRPSFNPHHPFNMGISSSQTTPDFAGIDKNVDFKGLEVKETDINGVDTFEVDGCSKIGQTYKIEGKSFTDKPVGRNHSDKNSLDTPHSRYLQKKKLGHKKSKSLNTRLDIFKKITPTIKVHKDSSVDHGLNPNSDENQTRPHLQRSTTCETFKSKPKLNSHLRNASIELSMNSLSTTHSQASSISSCGQFEHFQNSTVNHAIGSQQTGSCFDLASMSSSTCEGSVSRRTVMKKGKVKSDLVSRWTRYWMVLDSITGQVLLFEKCADRSIDKKSNDVLNRDFYKKQPSKRICLRDSNSEAGVSHGQINNNQDFNSIYNNMVPWYIIDRERDGMLDLCHRNNGTLYRFKIEPASDLDRWVNALNSATSSHNNIPNTFSLDTDFSYS